MSLTKEREELEYSPARTDWEPGEPPENVPIIVQVDWFASDSLPGVETGKYTGTSEFPAVIQFGLLKGLDNHHPEPESSGLGPEDICRWRYPETPNE